MKSLQSKMNYHVDVKNSSAWFLAECIQTDVVATFYL